MSTLHLHVANPCPHGTDEEKPCLSCINDQLKDLRGRLDDLSLRVSKLFQEEGEG